MIFQNLNSKYKIGVLIYAIFIFFNFAFINNSFAEVNNTASNLPINPASQYPKNLQSFNTELYQILLELGIKPKKTKSISQIKLMDVTCTILTIKEKDNSLNNICTFKQLHNNLNSSYKNIKQTKTTKKQIPAAEKLRLFLSRFPVSQGDSGASTSFIECNKIGDEPICSLAIQINYEGP